MPDNLELFDVLWKRCTPSERRQIRKKIESKRQQHYREQAREILDFLNAEAGKNFRPVEANLTMIAARLADGVSVSDCKAVIVRRVRKWRGNSDMQEYLRPATLFNRTKFEQYMGDLQK